MARLYNGTNMRSFTNGTPVTAAPLTLAIWCYPTSLSGLRCMLDINQESGAGLENFSIGIDGNTDTAWCEAGDGAETYVNSTTTLALNTWFHVAGVYASATSRTVYLNGGGSATSTVDRTPDGVSQINVGVYGRGNDGTGNFNFFAGRLAWASIWDVALSETEVIALAGGVLPLTIRPTNLVYCAPLFGDDSPEPDWNPTGGTRYALNLINSPTQANGPPVESMSQQFWRAGYPVEAPAVAGGSIPIAAYGRGVLLGGGVL